MVIVNPGTIKFCQSGCRKKMKFSNLCPQHPEEFRVFGGVCKKCRPNAIVESISAESLNKSEEPQNRETILVINDSNIIFDRYKVATKGESECAHLFGGNNRMVGCGVDSKNNSNDNLIYKTRIENEDKSTQIRINETNTQSSNSDIGNKNGYDVCGKGEIIHSSGKYFHADILNEIVD